MRYDIFEVGARAEFNEMMPFHKEYHGMEGNGLTVVSVRPVDPSMYGIYNHTQWVTVIWGDEYKQEVPGSRLKPTR